MRSNGLRFTVLEVEGSRIQRLEVEFSEPPPGIAEAARRRADDRGAARRRAAGGRRSAIRDFRLFWLSSVATGLALSMSQVAIGWQVYELSGDPLDLGLVGLAEFLPLPRSRSRPGISPTGCRGGRCSVRDADRPGRVVGLLAVTIAGASSLWPFFLLAFATGVASALGAPPARADAVARAVRNSSSARSRSARWACRRRSSWARRSAGCSSRSTPELVYSSPRLSCSSPLGCLLGLRRAAGSRRAEGAGPRRACWQACGSMRRTPVLFGAISLDLFAVLLGGAVALLPVFAKDILDVGPTGLGLLRSAPAVGSLAGHYLARPADRALRRPYALRRRGGVRPVDGRLRALAVDVALDRGARRQRRASTW